MGVTAGKASHNTSNARGVTAGKMGCNSSQYNYVKKGKASKKLHCPFVYVSVCRSVCPSVCTPLFFFDKTVRLGPNLALIHAWIDLGVVRT